LFISYANEDRPFADALCERLAGYRIYLDSKRLAPGKLWKPALDAAQAASFITVVLYSKHSKKSAFQQHEIEFACSLAESEDHTVVPVFIAPVTPRSKVVPAKLCERQGFLAKGTTNLSDLVIKLREGLARIKTGRSQPNSKPVTVEITIDGEPTEEMWADLREFLVKTGGGNLRILGRKG
jgi:hypothetical protein